MRLPIIAIVSPFITIASILNNPYAQRKSVSIGFRTVQMVASRRHSRALTPFFAAGAGGAGVPGAVVRGEGETHSPLPTPTSVRCPGSPRENPESVRYFSTCSRSSERSPERSTVQKSPLRGRAMVRFVVMSTCTLPSVTVISSRCPPAVRSLVMKWRW